MYNLKKKYILKQGLNKKSGRNFRGKITVYHHGGGNKINYRLIDFKHKNLQGIVKDIQYDPIRSSYIALLFNNTTNQYFNILAPQDLKIDDQIFVYT